jgi:hypothetical protein
MSNYASNVAGSCGAAGDDVIHSISIPTASGTGFTIFSTLTMDSTASTGIDTAEHITTVCGTSANELRYSSAPCGAAIGAGATCANTAGTDEVLRACGMPSSTIFGGSPYIATLDSTVATGAWTMSLALTPLNLDTCAQSGNISNTPLSPTTYTNTTTGKAANYVYDATSAALTGCLAAQRNACGLPNGDPSGNVAVCGSDGGAAAEDIVFYYYAGTTGFLTVDTQGSSFDTVLYMKSGCNPNCLPPSDCLACNDDNNFLAVPAQSWSRLYCRPVTAGTLYYIVVDGYGGADGTVALNAKFSAVGCP